MTACWGSEQRRTGITVAAVHVGLDLIFLVPGETGGLEVYARVS